MRYTITTMKGEYSSDSLREICEWQAETQGAHADIDVRLEDGRTISVDVSDIEFSGSLEPESRMHEARDLALDATVARVEAAIAVETIGASDVKALRADAAQAGDLAQVAICDIALHGEIDERVHLTAEERAAIAAEWTKETALAECARVIAEAAAGRE